MDDKTADAFERFGLLNDETKSRLSAERIATLAMIDQLEAKYEDRGLKFTVPFSGAVPVQAFGHIDGLRFYFRFRGNYGSLAVGPYNLEIEELRVKRINEDIAKRREKASKDDIWGMEPDERVTKESASDFYPHQVTMRASAQGDNPEDHYNGYLDNQEAFNMFSKLAGSLEEVTDFDEQLGGTFTRVWYYEGRDAANAWQTQWDEDNQDIIQARLVRFQEMKKKWDEERDDEDKKSF